MNLFEKIIYFLQGEMARPETFGWFHLMWIFVALIVIILLYIRKNTYNEKQLKIVLGTYSIVALVLELLKQISWSFNYDAATNGVMWDYEWYSFPFQLCTTPIYVCLICFFLRKTKIRDSLLSYISFVTILGSVATAIMPDSCFVSDILVNVHTMWLHLGSLVVSVYLLFTGEVKLNITNFKNAIIIFLMFVICALSMNYFIYNIGVLNGETFNMFFISPYFTSTLPVFNIIQQSVTYILFLFIYIFAISGGAFIIYLISKIFICKKED